MSDSHTTQRKRLIYRAHYRGTKESDAVLAPYAKAQVPQMSATELEIFEAFLNEIDANIRAWIEDRAAVPEKYQNIVEALS